MKIGLAGLLFTIFIFWNRSKIEIAWAMRAIERAGLKDDFTKAVPLCRQWLVRRPDHPRVHELHGFLAVRQGDLTHGTESYARAIRLSLRASDALDHLAFGQEYLRRGEYRKALAEFRLQTQLRPRQTEASFGLGMSWHGLGQIQKAIDAYKSALYRKTDDALYKKMLEHALNDRRKGRMTYITDRKSQPLAQWMFASSTPLYMRGYHAAHAVGYQHPRFGVSGLEAVFRDHFPGSRLTTTLDMDMQALAEQAFEQGSRWGRGSMIVMRPSTGEILAFVSRPTFNPNRLDKDWNTLVTHKKEPLKIRPVEALYEPGSIAKLMTATAWLEASKRPPDPWPFRCEGAMMFDHQKFWDWRPHGEIRSLTEAMDVSCNAAFAKAGLALGPQALLTWAKRFGFNESIPFDLPITPSTFPPPAGVDLQTAELASGLGQGFLMSPFQALCIIATIANDGLLMQPTLIKSLHGVDGHPISTFEPKSFRRVMSRRTARELQQVLLNGVTDGISKRAAVEGLTIGGKTGTSGSAHPGFHAWFACFAGPGRPEYAVLISVEHGGMGMTVAAPIAHRFFAKMLEQGLFSTEK